LGSSLPASQFVVSDSALRSFVPTAVITHHITAMDASSYWLVSFSEFVLPWPPPTTTPAVPPLGLPLPSSRLQFERALLHRASHVSTPFRPQRFARSRRFSPPRTLRICFTPLPRPGFSFRGFRPSPSCRSSSLQRCLLVGSSAVA
jgi:hypothetical protein